MCKDGDWSLFSQELMNGERNFSYEEVERIYGDNFNKARGIVLDYLQNYRGKREGMKIEDQKTLMRCSVNIVALSLQNCMIGEENEKNPLNSKKLIETMGAIYSFQSLYTDSDVKMIGEDEDPLDYALEKLEIEIDLNEL